MWPDWWSLARLASLRWSFYTRPCSCQWTEWASSHFFSVPLLVPPLQLFWDSFLPSNSNWAKSFCKIPNFFDLIGFFVFLCWWNVALWDLPNSWILFLFTSCTECQLFFGIELLLCVSTEMIAGYKQSWFSSALSSNWDVVCTETLSVLGCQTGSVFVQTLGLKSVSFAF